MQAKQLLKISIACTLFFAHAIQSITSYSYYDPFPIYNTLDPHTFLQNREKEYIKGYPRYVKHFERVGLSLSPFGQNADKARDLENKEIELGEIGGRWNMIGLLFGEFPEGETEFSSATLHNAFSTLFSANTAAAADVANFTAGHLHDGRFTDPAQQIGFYRNELRYRKRGVRWEFDVQVLHDVGFCFQGGIADICHTVKNMENLTCNDPEGCCKLFSGGDFTSTPDGGTINSALVCKLETIADELCWNIKSFHELSLEDTRFRIYWRHIIDLNRDYVSWPGLLLIPFITFGGSIATGKERNPSHLFSLSFGSQDHHAVGTTCGLNLDFIETVEIGAEFGFTHFFKRTIYNTPFPTSIFQSGIYPFKTDITVQPGHNWHFGLKMSAYHFLYRLSGYFQYILLHHEKDSIRLKQCDPAFKSEVIENISSFKVQLANVGLTYDISPHISIGALWQMPLARRNAYRTSTVMFTFYASY